MSAFVFNPNDLHRLNRLLFVLRGVRLDSRSGGHQNRRTGEGTEFLDYRAYMPGDDVRNIDWNLFGRLRQLFIRQRELPRQLGVTLLVDSSRSMCFGTPVSKLQQAQRLACALAFVALRGGDRVSIASFSDRLHMGPGPISGVRLFPTIIAGLERLPSGGSKSDFLAAARQLRTLRQHRGLVVVLSDFLNVEQIEPAIASIQGGGGRLLIVQILDGFDRGNGLQRTVLRLRDSESGQLVDVRITPAALAAFQADFERRRRSLEELIQQRGQTYLRADTADNYLELICDALRSKAVLR